MKKNGCSIKSTEMENTKNYKDSTYSIDNIDDVNPLGST